MTSHRKPFRPVLDQCGAAVATELRMPWPKLSEMRRMRGRSYSYARGRRDVILWKRGERRMERRRDRQARRWRARVNRRLMQMQRRKGAA